MYQARKLAQLIKEMNNYKIEILGVSETRWNESGQYWTNEGHRFLYLGMLNVYDDHRAGVGIILSNKVRQSMI